MRRRVCSLSISKPLPPDQWVDKEHLNYQTICSTTWQPIEVSLDDGRILVLDDS
jgi:hypothetical protein